MIAAALGRGYEPQSAFEPKARVIYALIGIELMLALSLFPLLGLTYADVPFMTPVIAALLMVVAAWASRRAGFAPVATWLEATTLTYLGGVVGWTLLYPATVWAFPYGDWWLSAADKMLGFDFPALYRATKGWPFYPIYNAFVWQAPLVVLILVAAKRDPWPLVLAVLVAIIPTILIYPFATAIGPIGYYHLGPPGAWTPTIEALRDHGVRTIRAKMLVGMVSLPSYHASVGILIIWATWRIRGLRWPFLALNVAMVFSTIPFGEHYLVDVLGGIVVAWVSILVAKRVYGKE